MDPEKNMQELKEWAQEELNRSQLPWVRDTYETLIETINVIGAGRQSSAIPMAELLESDQHLEHVGRPVA
ncbi:MAG: hypothetical protein OXB98_05980 [Bryobacterales bacterium]|nr:hypothetical protein [Bryobacterales bacterium]